MPILADITASVVRALSGVAEGFHFGGVKAIEELPRLAAAFREAVEDFTEAHPTITATAAFTSPIALATFTGAGLGSPQSFARELFDKWNAVLQDAFSQLNVEVTEFPEGTPQEPIFTIGRKLSEGSELAQEKVSAALLLINFIILSGNIVSVAAEAASAGTVRSIAEAVQSWIWANGLGSFSPLAFQPQVNASINPYLTRFFNSRAQAQIPPVTDVIRMQLREVYLEGRREELVGTEDRPIFDALMKEWGFDKFHADSYWGAHWILPSIGQLNEMLFRNVIDRETWERFVRFNDLEPSSIPRLGEIIFNPYTRVDVRRMARLGILSDEQLLQAYADLGFFAETLPDGSGQLRAVFKPDFDPTVDKAQGLVVFTKLFNALPELRQRFSKGWISREDVRDGLVATGLPEARVEIVFQTIVRNDAGERTAPERELTRGLVARAWKLRLVGFQQAVFLLERMGWSGPEAELILSVQSLPDDVLAAVNTNLGFRLGAGAPARTLPTEGTGI